MTRFARVDLYPVISPEFCAGRPATAVLTAVLAAGARIVQLRDKRDPAREAAAFREITARHGALLIINDSLETALAVGADGVHLGQEDLPTAAARSRGPELIIGVSTHDRDMALAAQAADASYVNIGPLFATATKPGARAPLGPAAIGAIAPALTIPFTVMGGISRKNIDLVLAAGARRVAMVTALGEAPDIEAAARFFVERIRLAPSPAVNR